MTPSATVAESRLSMAPRMAMVKATGMSVCIMVHEIVGTTMSGNWLWMWKRSPMVSSPTMPYCFMMSTAAVPTKMP